MAESRRKKLDKLDKLGEEPSAKRYLCCCCGVSYSRRKGAFSVSHSPLHHGSKHLPFCYDCAERMFAQYELEYGGKRQAMRRMCMMMDAYWNESIADMAENSKSSWTYFKTYLSKANAERFATKSYDDTLREEAAATMNEKVFCGSLEGGEVPTEVVRFWGPGLSPRQYIEYEERFRYLKAVGYPEDYGLTLGEETLLRKLAALEVDDNYERAAGKPSDKNTALINTLIGSANLKPVQKQIEANDAKLEGMPLGVGIQKWELERPLPPTPEELKDRNGLVKDITTWFFGHTSKMVGLKNSWCSLYEEAMDRLRVSPTLYEEDDDTLLTDIFADKNAEFSQKVGDPLDD